MKLSEGSLFATAKMGADLFATAKMGADMNKQILLLTFIGLFCGSSAYGNTLPDTHTPNHAGNHAPTNHSDHQNEKPYFPKLSHMDCFPQHRLSTDTFFHNALWPHNKTACSFLQEKTYGSPEHICLFSRGFLCLNKNRFLSTSTSMLAGGLLVTLAKQVNNILEYGPLMGEIIAKAPAECAALASTLLVFNQCLDIYGRDYLPETLYTPIHKYKRAIIQLGQCVDLECDIEKREFMGGIIKKAFLGTVIAKSIAFASSLIPMSGAGVNNSFAKKVAITLFNMGIGMAASQLVYSFEAIKRIDGFIPSYILNSMEYEEGTRE